MNTLWKTLSFICGTLAALFAVVLLGIVTQGEGIDLSTLLVLVVLAALLTAGALSSWRRGTRQPTGR